MGTREFKINWKSKVMLTALGVVVAGASIVSSGASATPTQPASISKVEAILDASRVVQGLQTQDPGKSSGGGVQEAQWVSYFNNWGNWSNWQNFNQWGNL